MASRRRRQLEARKMINLSVRRKKLVAYHFLLSIKYIAILLNSYKNQSPVSLLKCKQGSSFNAKVEADWI